jgi:hypothetical protein
LFSLDRQLVHCILVGVTFVSWLRLNEIDFAVGDPLLLGNFLSKNGLLALVRFVLSINIMKFVCAVRYEKGLVFVGLSVLFTFTLF